MSHKKFGPIGSAVLTYWIQTNKQTPKQTDKPNLYIDDKMKKNPQKIETLIWIFEMKLL